MSASEGLIPPRGSRSDNHTLQFIESILANADVRIGGTRPWDIQLHDSSVPARVLAHGSLGFGEAYMDGHWDCARLDQLFDRLLRSRVDREVRGTRAVLHHLRARFLICKMSSVRGK
ncbi:hypothetical protein [Burkholderia sp. Ac-20345]|uniref:hypothetical protein n=1 Tax=Burkholderia sp. Ac-20345 TaxID=2703891 RepID=UPI001F11AB31|nr:hypothetical protein [Burkholderia sp. Ac-20345]